MQFVKPRAILIAQTEIAHTVPEEFQNMEVAHGLEAFLEAVGAEGWSTDAESGVQQLIEVAGKTCYRSFNTDVNPNLTQVRNDDNETYIKNILRQRHGSVLEHSSVTFGFVNVSRVFTHELVRHRIASYSQESLRYVRLTELKAYFPQAFTKDFFNEVNAVLGSERKGHIYGNPEELEATLRQLMQTAYEQAEAIQKTLERILLIDDKRLSMHYKKVLTSAMRRFAPDGLATVIICTMNMRMWRHVLEMRTDPAAEEEIREVFGQVAVALKAHYPNVFQDMINHTGDGHFYTDFGRV